MTLIVDAGPLIAMADPKEAQAGRILEVIEGERGAVVVPAYVAAEADHLIARRIGLKAERTFLRDLASGAYEVEAMTEDEHRLAVEVDADHPGLGLADLSIVILAARYRTRRVLTFDERDFRSVRTLDGEPFVLLPSDEPAPRG